MHEDCRLHGASEDEFARALAADGARPTWRLGAFDDVERPCATASTACARAPSSPPASTSTASSSTPRPGRCRESR